MKHVRVPGDKSISHRALILGALAEGRSVLRNLLTAADAQTSGNVLRWLGCPVPALPANAEPLRLAGVGLHGLEEPSQVLYGGNSGTTVRLMLGVLSGYEFQSVHSGDASLCARPMRRVTTPLSEMGAKFTELGEPDRLPIAMRGGPLTAIDYTSPRASAQVKSAILLAGLTGGAPVRVSEPTLSRDHTERMLQAMGVPVARETSADGTHTVSIEPVERLAPIDIDVPGDFSSAAFFIALAALGGTDDPLRIEGVGVNPARAGLLAVLRRMGGDVEIDNERIQAGEPVADIVVRAGPLSATSVGAAEIPAMIDEVPALAALAVRAQGETEITGASELRVKESDRLAMLARNLRAIGVAAEELEDGLVIQGSDRPLVGRVESAADHRIAMTFGVLAALPASAIEIDDPAVAAVSFTDFWQRLRDCAGGRGPV